MRRVGLMIQSAPGDTIGKQTVAEFLRALAALGWIHGRNVSFDVRWAAGGAAQGRTNAKELVALAPDVIVAFTSSLTSAVARETKTIPVVFTGVTDPVGLGLVASLARPGGNLTGFAVEPSIGGKWIQILKELAPKVTRVLAPFNSDPGSGGLKTLPPLRAAAAELNVRLVVRFPKDVTALLATIDDFAREAAGGLVVPPSAVAVSHVSQIVSAAARNRLPAIYTSRIEFVERGGLAFYGATDTRLPQVASYVDRILRGAQPADLPVQNPTYQLWINVKTAKALGLIVPQSLLMQADKLIE